MNNKNIENILNIPDNEFRLVTRKKWIAKQTRRKGQHIMAKDTDIDINKLLSDFESISQQMLTCEYFKRSVALIEGSLKSRTDGKKLLRIVCFGIGPFSRQYVSFHQLVFILMIQRHFAIKTAIFFDPIFTELEKKILCDNFNCEIMAENTLGKFLADFLTLFYLPHCAHMLTNNLLWENWQPANLRNTLIISNSFAQMSINQINRYFRKTAAYILTVIPYTEEMPLENTYRLDNVFNDLSLHVFPVQKLPDEEESTFWAKGAVPVYDNNDDDEIIKTDKA